MSVHKYSSWGRTRRPKNITGTDGVKVTGTTIGALSALDIAGTGSHASATNGVYKTENQRYLHLHASGSSSGCDNVYTYLYASQQWSEYKTHTLGTATSGSVTVDANSHIVYEIYGADLIAFNTGSNSDGIYAAFSTF